MRRSSICFDHAVRLGDDAWCSASVCRNGAGTRRCWRSIWRSPISGSILLGQATLFLGVAGDIEGKRPRRRRARLHPRRARFPQLPARRAAKRRFRADNRAAVPVLELAGTPDARIAAAPEPRLAAIAAKAVKEIAYHARFANEWVVRLGDGTEESRARMIAGLEWMWRFADELFDPKRRCAVASGREWDSRIARVLNEARLEQPKPRRGVLGGRAGHHSEHLGICYAKCSSCSAPIREPCGDAHFTKFVIPAKAGTQRV